MKGLTSFLFFPQICSVSTIINILYALEFIFLKETVHNYEKS